MRRAERLLAWLWIVLTLSWAGFIVGTRFRIGDGYATGFGLTDLTIIAGPPLVLLLIGVGIAFTLRMLVR